VAVSGSKKAEGREEKNLENDVENVTEIALTDDDLTIIEASGFKGIGNRQLFVFLESVCRRFVLAVRLMSKRDQERERESSREIKRESSRGERKDRPRIGTLFKKDSYISLFFIVDDMRTRR